MEIIEERRKASETFSQTSEAAAAAAQAFSSDEMSAKLAFRFTPRLSSEF